MSQLRHWLWLYTLPGLSLRSQLRLLEYFGTPEAVFLADRDALIASGAVAEKDLAALERRDLRRADRVLETCREKQFGILTMQDAAYPQRLLSIEQPPPVLFYQGSLLPFDSLPVIAVVGARDASGYGLITAKRLGMQMAACGGVVLSGAARGVDSLALEGALSTGAPVAAVLGCGLDVVYPRSAANLYADVARQGCLLSEFLPGTPPLGTNFPRRNRIMSGLSLGVLVIEAARGSGSLITADLAAEQGRDVFAVPGNIGLPCCEGSNELLQDGAYLVTCGWDVLQGYQSRFPERLRRWRGGDSLTLSPQDIKYLQSVYSPDGQDGPASEPVPEAASGKELPADPDEKRIDNREKRNYIDLKQIMDSLTQDEQTLFRLLQDGQRHVDELIAESGMPASRVLASLTLLEVKGCIVQLPGKRFDLKMNT